MIKLPAGSLWTVLEEAEPRADPRDSRWRLRPYWRCRCKCGRERDVSEATLVHGHSKSCGCTRTLRKAAVDGMPAVPAIKHATPERIAEWDIEVAAIRAATGRRDLSCSEIGRVLGIGKQRVQQIEASILRKLARVIREAEERAEAKREEAA